MKAQGYSLETAAVIVPNQEQLGHELAAKMPPGKRFGILVQGTEKFSQYMEELANDTIWPDE